MMEEVILWNEEETNNVITVLFPKLKFLSIVNLPRLTSFSKGIKSIEFPVLEEIQVRDCTMTSFVSMDSLTTCRNHDDDAIHLLCKSDKVEISSLEKLEMGGYNGTSRYWCPQLPMIGIFSGLSELKIDYIDGIKSLFSCSVAQNLQNMRYLTIWSCKEMVGVIKDNACGGETPPCHLFPNLEELELHNLPKLKSFCEWRCALEFPLLTYLTISRCEVMEKFTSGPLNTPVLKSLGYRPHASLRRHRKVKIRTSNKEFTSGLLSAIDVNTILQQRFLEKKKKQKSQLQGSLVAIKEEVGE